MRILRCLSIMLACGATLLAACDDKPNPTKPTVVVAR